MFRGNYNHSPYSSPSMNAQNSPRSPFFSPQSHCQLGFSPNPMPNQWPNYPRPEFFDSPFVQNSSNRGAWKRRSWNRYDSPQGYSYGSNNSSPDSRTFSSQGQPNHWRRSSGSFYSPGPGGGGHTQSPDGDCNPGGSGNIKDYVHPAMLEDPWADLVAKSEKK